jgi:hypothetical protein
MATMKKAVKKAKGPLTVEQRLERIEKDFRFLAAKLRTHGIHLDAQTEPDDVAQGEPQEVDNKE